MMTTKTKRKAAPRKVAAYKKPGTKGSKWDAAQYIAHGYPVPEHLQKLQTQDQAMGSAKVFGIHLADLMQKADAAIDEKLSKMNVWRVSRGVVSNEKESFAKEEIKSPKVTAMELFASIQAGQELLAKEISILRDEVLKVCPMGFPMAPEPAPSNSLTDNLRSVENVIHWHVGCVAALSTALREELG